MQTPHAGYHSRHNLSQSFFEGWYYRLTLPEIAQSFAFMYSIQDPGGKQSNSGGAVQILGIDEQYLCRTFPDVNGFWAANNYLGLGHWGKSKLSPVPRLSKAGLAGDRWSIPPQFLSPQEFTINIEQGYQATATLNQGCINLPDGSYCHWEYKIKPVYGWGNKQQIQQATAGWLSYLPLYDPGWQILMAHGLATGWINWGGKIYQFTDAPAYSEKNWGYSFPKQWFWVNCNSFNHLENLALTAGGGIRNILWWEEEVALIGIHYQGKFYEFAPWNSQITWEVEPWGKWYIAGENRDFVVEIIGVTDLSGTYVRTPTAKGLVFNCRDTAQGKLSLKIRDRNKKVILQADTNLAGLEVGNNFD